MISGLVIVEGNHLVYALLLKSCFIFILGCFSIETLFYVMAIINYLTFIIIVMVSSINSYVNFDNCRQFIQQICIDNFHI